MLIRANNWTPAILWSGKSISPTSKKAVAVRIQKEENEIPETETLFVLTNFYFTCFSSKLVKLVK